MKNEAIDYMEQWKQLLADFKSLNSMSDDDRLLQLLSLFGKYFELVQGVVFRRGGDEYHQVVAYAFIAEEELSFREGEGIIGQAVKEKKIVFLSDVNISYFTIVSGLGSSNKLNLLIFPLKKNNQVEVVFELAFFKHFSEELIEKMKELETYYFKK